MTRHGHHTASKPSASARRASSTARSAGGVKRPGVPKVRLMGTSVHGHGRQNQTIGRWRVGVQTCTVRSMASKETLDVVNRADPTEELRTRKEAALAGSGPEAVAKLHESGRQTARERIAALVDAGSFFEIGMLAEPELRRDDRVTTGDGIVT